MAENTKNSVEKDDFWDLSDLVPRRKPSAARPSSRTLSVEAVEIGVSTPEATGSNFQDVPLTERLVSPYAAQSVQKAPEPECTYEPQGSLLRCVRMYPWKNEYTYYEQFRHHAEVLVEREGKECPEVDFFSYMPQYTQLSAAQLEYYLWWRTSFRRGVCLPVSYSYLLLYLYELINLDEAHFNPKTGCENMVRLWLCYREKHPRLDVLIREWLCDYCLLHRLPPPRLDPALYRVLLSGCRLKEFYVTTENGRNALSRALLLFCNNYDYTKSKFYRPDTKEDYDRVLGGAIDQTVAFLQETSGAHLTDAGGVSTISRDTFSGAVCSWRLKRRIEVDYTSFSHTHELRYIMTDVLKYAENALRANRGIKSRLSIYAISIPLRQRLDAYLEQALPPKQSRATAPKREIPDYERRYDLPVVPVSFENAAAIEAESWQTTKRLVEAFGGVDEEFTPNTVREKRDFEQQSAGGASASLPPNITAASALYGPPVPPAAPACGGLHPTFGGLSTPAPSAHAAAGTPLASALGPLAAFFALSGDAAAQRAFARACGMMVDAIADKINTVAGDILGDIVLEEQNGAYVIIEDYLEFLIEQGVLSNGK